MSAQSRLRWSPFKRPEAIEPPPPSEFSHDGLPTYDLDQRFYPDRRIVGLHILAYVIPSILLGALLAYSLAPSIFRRVPTDLTRTRVLLDALHKPGARPEVAVLGSSIAMNGVDARRLRSDLPGQPLVYNLSSPQQSLAESLLYYQNLPSSVKVVVDVVITETLQPPHPHSPCIDPNTFNAFYMYGYRPKPSTVQTLSTDCGRPTHDLLTESRLEQTFNSRWALHQWADSVVFRKIQKNAGANRVVNDLYFPAFLPQVTPAQQEVQFRQFNTPAPDVGYSLSPENRALIRSAAEINARAGRRFVVVFAPLHPRMQRFYGPKYLADLQRLATSSDLGPNTSVVDLTTLLSADQFVDRLHANADGASRLTDAIAAGLPGVR